jgi:hypothetical protein
MWSVFDGQMLVRAPLSDPASSVTANRPIPVERNTDYTER